MGGLLSGLAVSALLLAAIAWGLARFVRLGAAPAAALAALLTAGGYLPVLLARWPGAGALTLHLGVWLATALSCGLALRRWEARNARRGDRLHWIPATIIGFFAALLVLNILFIVLAERGLAPAVSAYLLPSAPAKGAVSSRFPGTISHDFQQKEALYNDYLEQSQRQRARGWRIQKGWLGRPVVNQPTVFKVAVHTREGEPLTGATVEGQWLRPADSRLDRTFELPESEPGVYQAPLSLPAAGLWDVVLVVRRGEERHEIRAGTEVGDR